MRRLYLQVYLAFVGILALFGVLTAIAVVVVPHDHNPRLLGAMGRLAALVVPEPGAPAEDVRAALEQLRAATGVDLSLYDAERRFVAAAGRRVEPPPARRMRSGWLGRGRVAMRLPDGRWLVAHELEPAGPVGLAWLLVFGLLAVSIAAGAYPLARRITRRLERLRARVDALGAGDLSTRVEVEGKDEVATLARGFNRAADRIERLVTAQRRMLASASHELRTPLARLRVAIELLSGESRPELREQATRDVAELDGLIEELLTASRLDAAERLDKREEVDVLALLAEEAARTGTQVSGSVVHVQADARLLRRMLRNLLENARRHAGTGLEASVERWEGGARVRVSDRGPGIPAEERERIFEPFYRPDGMRETGEGVGLGLALVRQIAESHGGEVRCLERPGGGCVFEVDLP